MAARKAAYFAREARVLVVSRSFVQKLESPDIEKKKADIREITDAGLSTLVGDAFLVIAALSDPEQNDRIGNICRSRGILFNNADGQPGDVILPAISRGGNFTLAISTGGSSPAVSRFIREHLEQELPELDAMIVLQSRLREELKRTEPDQARRNAILRSVLDDKQIWRLLKKDPAAAWEKVSSRYVHG